MGLDWEKTGLHWENVFEILTAEVLMHWDSDPVATYETLWRFQGRKRRRNRELGVLVCVVEGVEDA